MTKNKDIRSKDKSYSYNVPEGTFKLRENVKKIKV